VRDDGIIDDTGDDGPGGDPGPSAELATLVVLLGRLERLNESFVGEACRSRDISPSELRVLAVLRLSAEQGPLRPTTISRRVVLSSGGLTATLRRLEGTGRVTRVDDPDDGRVRLVALTGDGARFYDELFADLLERYRQVLEGLGTDAVLAAVRQLVAALEPGRRAAPSQPWELAPLGEAAPGSAAAPLALRRSR
jgi:DNA-binding MarR family transcriptional regulator